MRCRVLEQRGSYLNGVAHSVPYIQLVSLRCQLQRRLLLLDVLHRQDISLCLRQTRSPHHRIHPTSSPLWPRLRGD